MSAMDQIFGQKLTRWFNKRKVKHWFDVSWYLKTNIDVARAGVDPIDHYLIWGAAEGRKPTSLFDADWYVKTYPEVRNNERLPFIDFIERGVQSGRNPNLLFDTNWYITREGLSKTQRHNLFGHYFAKSQTQIVQTSPLFDADWYTYHYSQFFNSKIDPLSHYLIYGAAQGFNPNPLFDSDWYNHRYNVRGGRAAAFEDYMSHKGARDPHPAFDTSWYLISYPEVAQSGLCPLAHYLTEGAQKGYNPHPLFDTIHYRAQSGQNQVMNPNALIDYLGSQQNWHKSTHPLFRSGWYNEQNPDVPSHNINPLYHFLSSGFKEGRNPTPLFNTRWYANKYQNFVNSDTNPLLEYLSVGAKAGRQPNHVFNGVWYLVKNGDVAAANLNPLSHYSTAGWIEGRDPSPLFDIAWYQARYPECNRSDVDPLEHYITVGESAGYAIRPVDRITHDCDALDIPFEILRSPTSLKDREACLFVTYSGDGKIADHVLTYIESLKLAGFAVVLIVVTEGLNEPLTPVIGLIDGLIVRMNHGWDFAAWATALAAFPDLWQARLIILTNDSLYGPANDKQFSDILNLARDSSKHLVSLCDSYQVKRHLMSFFTVITKTGLKHPAIRDFWNGVRSNRDKQTVINEYEIRSVERWEKLDVTYEVIFPATITEDLAINPTLHGWRDLLTRGFPFVKAQLLRERPHHIEISGWEEFFRDSPGLKAQIEKHLAERRHHTVFPLRPVPNPKQRFIQSDSLKTYYGATTSCRPVDEVDLALEVPFRPIGHVSFMLPERVAVIAHIFYTDFCSDLINHLRYIPVLADIFISTDLESKKTLILDAFSDYTNGTVEVRILPNIGRDIAPMLIGFNDVFKRYDVFLHLHSKKSPHDPIFAPWRDFLLTNILGSEETVRSILHLFEAEDVGIVFSQHFGPVRNLLNFGYNFDSMRTLLARCGVSLSTDLVLEFPSSSFFWGRSAALAPLLSIGLDWPDFPLEAGQVDGTTAHAIERSLLYVAEHAGFRWAKVAKADQVPVETLVPVQGTSDVALALARVHRPLLHNRVPRPKDANLLSEINPIATRRGSIERPRLNLLVPTLQPAKTFGGLTTAIRLFEELADAFKNDIDLRIISVSERIDLRSMLRFPDYRLLQISAPSDELSKVVLDASERQRGYLAVRRNDVFMATAWWTAHSAYHFQSAQEKLHGIKKPIIYLVQDHEPDFYGWSSQYGQAQRTYSRSDDTITLLNSEELANFYAARYNLSEARVVPFQLNSAISLSLSPRSRERIILVYGRPGTARNCFGLLFGALAQWQRTDPVEADRWRIISAGEDFDPIMVSHVRNLEVHGKLSLSEYGEMLSRASIGISLMASPHPSYPPLEMAYSGLRTVTNVFENKDLSKRSSNIHSVFSLDAGEIADALAEAVRVASPRIGTVVPATPLATVPCAIPSYDPVELAGYISRLFD